MYHKQARVSCVCQSAVGSAHHRGHLNVLGLCVPGNKVGVKDSKWGGAFFLNQRVNFPQHPVLGLRAMFLLLSWEAAGRVGVRFPSESPAGHMATGWQLKGHSQDAGDKRRVVQRRGWKVESGQLDGLCGRPAGSLPQRSQMDGCQSLRAKC